jgi:hypothetical protein
MPRVIVTTETSDYRERSTLLSECVGTVHMASEQSSLQFLERLAWAISDAEIAERHFEPALTPWLPSAGVPRRFLGLRSRGRGPDRSALSVAANRADYTIQIFPRGHEQVS